MHLLNTAIPTYILPEELTEEEWKALLQEIWEDETSEDEDYAENNEMLGSGLSVETIQSLYEEDYLEEESQEHDNKINTTLNSQTAEDEEEQLWGIALGLPQTPPNGTSTPIDAITPNSSSPGGSGIQQTLDGSTTCQTPGASTTRQTPGGSATCQTPGGSATCQTPGGSTTCQTPGGSTCQTPGWSTRLKAIPSGSGLQPIPRWPATEITPYYFLGFDSDEE